MVRSGASPVDGFVLTGPSTFFARLRHRQVRFIDDPTAALGLDPAAAATRVAHAARVIAQGRQLFLNETFDGNGRTCGTCHAETNNFTVDPELIATLPRPIRSLWRREIRRWRRSKIQTCCDGSG